MSEVKAGEFPYRKREALGELVRNIWIDFAEAQAVKTGIPAKPHHLIPWKDLDEDNREVDMRIGEALYFYGCNDMSERISSLDAWEYCTDETDFDRACNWLLSAIERQQG